MRYRHPTTLLAASLCTCLSMQAAPQSNAAKPVATELSLPAVSGVLPGPALWKVTKDSHTMWVLGVTHPLPRRLQWETAVIERAVGGSQAVLKAPGLKFGAHVGFFGRLFLIPSMVGIKKLPNGQPLLDVLSPALYARWEVQSVKYLGSTTALDRLRPMFAGEKLYSAAIRNSALTNDGGVEDQVMAFANHDNVPVVDTAYLVMLKDPRADATLFKQASMPDQQCLAGILNAIENDLAQATERANAWANDDVAALQTVLATPQQDECLSAVGNTEFAQKLGITDISQRIRDAWLKAAEESMAKNPQTTALLLIDKLLAPDGYLSALAAKGYVVTAPEG